MVWFQHTAARRRLAQKTENNNRHRRFNTQPPEGGWTFHGHPMKILRGFNTQPPEGGWNALFSDLSRTLVSTHSRPKAAGTDLITHVAPYAVSTHSRPKAAGPAWAPRKYPSARVSTHSRPKAAGHYPRPETPDLSGFNTQPPEGGWAGTLGYLKVLDVFQHTAARRRLAPPTRPNALTISVSTHSRPKAAGRK